MKNGVVVKAIVVNDRGEILSLRRSKTDPRRPMQWDLPGGFLEKGESFTEGCAREVKEETGLDITPDRLVLINGISDITDFGNITWLYFLAKTKVHDIELSFEHDKSQWISLDDAVNAFEYPRHKALLTYVQKNNLLSIV